ncbi:hypothetical protein AB1Y20_009174 [Prymnesium parvum]|uniref:KIF-binding protein n=1 Tax=Prymnesium parvum TaxID=97485 RepID=A0AB34K481_PRYPA
MALAMPPPNGTVVAAKTELTSVRSNKNTKKGNVSPSVRLPPLTRKANAAKAEGASSSKPAAGSKQEGAASARARQEAPRKAKQETPANGKLVVDAYGNNPQPQARPSAGTSSKQQGAVWYDKEHSLRVRQSRAKEEEACRSERQRVEDDLRAKMGKMVGKEDNETAVKWRQFSLSNETPNLATQLSNTDEHRALQELSLVDPVKPGAEGPEGLPYLSGLSCPSYNGSGKMSSVVEGKEDSPEEVIAQAQRSWAKAEGWTDHASCVYLGQALELCPAMPQFIPIAGRLLARVGLAHHQGQRNGADVLAYLKGAAARAHQSDRARMLKHRHEHKLVTRLGKLCLPNGADTSKASLSIKRQGPIQRGPLAFFDQSYEKAICEADIKIFAEQDAYEDALSCMLIILSHYLAGRYEAFIASFGQSGAALSSSVAPPLLLRSIQASKEAEFASGSDFPLPKAQYTTNSLSGEIVSTSADAQLALWGELSEKHGAAMLKLDNTFSLDDETSGMADYGFGLQHIDITHVYAPVREAKGKGDDDGPLTFGDMVADTAGFDAAVKAAVEANVQLAEVQEEEHYTTAAELFKTLPGLKERPIKVVAHLTLILSYYDAARKRLELPRMVHRAPALRAVSMECAQYKNAK